MTPPSPADAPSAPRRLTWRARRDQLVAAATVLVARHGPGDLSLDELAQRVGVTRNLLYHYFPGGREDLVREVVEEARRQLLGAPSAPGVPHPPPQTLDQALTRILDHALAPTHAWRIHRLARPMPALNTSLEDSVQSVSGAIIKATGGESSPQLELILHGYLAFAETILDEARTVGIPRSDIRKLLARVLRVLLTAA